MNTRRLVTALIALIPLSDAHALTIDSAVHGTARYPPPVFSVVHGAVQLRNDPPRDVGVVEIAITTLSAPVASALLEIAVTTDTVTAPVTIEVRGYSRASLIGTLDSTDASDVHPIVATLILDAQATLSIDVTATVNAAIAIDRAYVGFNFRQIEEVNGGLIEFGTPQMPQYPALRIDDIPDVSETAALNATPAQPASQFANALSISGNTLVVGAWEEDEPPPTSRLDSGAAYVFVRDAGGWSQADRLIPDDADDHQRLGFSAANHDELVAVGTFPDAPADIVGAVYLFRRDGPASDDWTQIKKLTGVGGLDRFGKAIAVGPDYVAVGDPYNALGFTGAVHIFEKDTGGPDNWGQAALVQASDLASSGEFGGALAASGNTLAVGALGRGYDTGAVYVLERNLGGAGNWGERAILTASDANTESKFGAAVALSGDTLLVGAPVADQISPNFGAVYVFERDALGDWHESARLLPEASAGGCCDNGARFGTSVAVGSNRLLVGTIWDYAFGRVEGSAYLYDRDDVNPANWQRTAVFAGSNTTVGDRFGKSVSMAGPTAVVGLDAVSQGGIGAAYVYDFAAPDPQCVLHSAPADFGELPTGDSREHAVALTNVGALPCDIVDVALTGGTQFSLGAAALPLALLPGVSATIDVVFAPQSGGALTDTLTVTTIQPQAFFVELRGTGVPFCNVTLPAVLDLGDVAPGDAATTPLIIGNAGTLDCSVILGLTGNAAVSIDPGMLGTPIAVAPGGSVTIDVHFAPLVQSFHDAIVNVQSNDPNDGSVDIPVQGFAPTAGCDLVVQPSALGFGSVMLGEAVELELSLDNFGMSDCTITQFGFSDSTNFGLGAGAPSPPFQIAPDDPPLGVFVSFAPTDATLFDAMLVIDSDDAAVPASQIPLSGEGFGDDDGDTIPDNMDNCLDVANVSQLDADGDGFGNRCDADLNNDCAVNASDLGIFRTLFFLIDTPADFDGNGRVDFIDLGILRLSFFDAPGPSAMTTACDSP